MYIIIYTVYLERKLEIKIISFIIFEELINCSLLLAICIYIVCILFYNIY